MRWIFALVVCAAPADAWTFSTTPLCTLTRVNDTASLRITYDPGLGEYALILRNKAGDIAAPEIFSITFAGPRGMTISTDRHTIEDGALTVRDRGFGNVLNGLEFNAQALAQVGDDTYAFDLSEAPPAVQDFRDCDVAPSV